MKATNVLGSVALAFTVGACRGALAPERLGTHVGGSSSNGGRATTVEGQLWGLRCAVSAGADATCTARAIEAGRPVAILTDTSLTTLLLDSRTLARPCARHERPRMIRIHGVSHSLALALTVFEVEERCGGRWVRHEIPASGISSAGWETGDE